MLGGSVGQAGRVEAERGRVAGGEAPSTDCPELADGATVDGSALGACIAEAMTDTAGYAAKTVVMGMESTTRFNPSEKRWSRSPRWARSSRSATTSG
ncbi:hypothetical protein AB1285_20670 [Microbacterium sp. NRRL B-14842]|uniref:hypothetical protein n=1 Tax=Microbacterium sp. NRRL B-14842 TaxID=3162881 RepID=UPI003D2C9547